MRALDSKFFDQTNNGNKVVARLNEDPTCNLSGLLNLNGGIINPAELSVLITQYWFRGQISKSDQKLKVISVSKDLKEKFNYLTEIDNKYLKSYDYRTLACVMYLMAQEQIPKEDYTTLIPLLRNDAEKLTKGFVIGNSGTSRKLQNLFNTTIENYYDRG